MQIAFPCGYPSRKGPVSLSESTAVPLSLEQPSVPWGAAAALCWGDPLSTGSACDPTGMHYLKKGSAVTGAMAGWVLRL